VGGVEAYESESGGPSTERDVKREIHLNAIVCRTLGKSFQPQKSQYGYAAVTRLVSLEFAKAAARAGKPNMTAAKNRSLSSVWRKNGMPAV